MADEIHPPDPLIPQPQTLTPISPPQTDPLDSTTNNTNTNPPKRQRRPSVRLGEIGGNDPTYDPRRPSKSTWTHQHPHQQQRPNSNNKTRPLTNLNFQQPKFRNKPTTKRARTNWTKFTPNNNNTSLVEENGNNDHDFLLESPVNSVEENMGLHYWDKLSRGNGNSVDEEEKQRSEEESVLGVRDWLNGLGLGKYAPLFDVHEVDQEVLPLLTLEDLRDMGINAVGSRRKMYSAILKLRKGLS